MIMALQPFAILVVREPALLTRRENPAIPLFITPEQAFETLILNSRSSSDHLLRVLRWSGSDRDDLEFPTKRGSGSCCKRPPGMRTERLFRVRGGCPESTSRSARRLCGRTLRAQPRTHPPC